MMKSDKSVKLFEISSYGGLLVNAARNKKSVLETGFQSALGIFIPVNWL